MPGQFLQECGERLQLNDQPLEVRFFQLARLQPKGGADRSQAAPEIQPKPDIVGLELGRFLQAEKGAGSSWDIFRTTDSGHLNGVLSSYNKRAGARLPPPGKARPFIAWARNVEYGLLLTYVQHWTCTGYTRGELLNSFSITPGGEVHVEVFTWDRQRVEQERNLELTSESTQTDSITSRIAIDTVTNTRFKVGAGAEYTGDGSLSLAEFGVPADIKAGEKVNVDSEFENSVTNTRNQVAEATQAATQSLRAARKTRVLETRERGEENRTTYTHKNTNRCLAVTYDYFEVLESYDVDLRFQDARLVVLLPLQMDDVLSPQWLLCHEHAIRPYLPDQLLAAGFDGARMVRAAEVFTSRLAPGRFLPIRPNLGGLFTPGRIFGAGTSNDPVRAMLMPHVEAIVKAAHTLRDARLDPLFQVVGREFDQDPHNNPTKAEFDDAVKTAGQALYRDLLLTVAADFLDQVDLLDQRTRPASSNVQEELRTFLTGTAPLLLNMSFGHAVQQVLGVPIPFNDAGLTGAMEAAQAALKDVREQPPVPAPPAPGGSGTSAAAGTAQSTKPTIDDLLDENFGLKNLAEAQVELERLQCHVQEKLDYYLGLVFADQGPAAWAARIASFPHLDGVVEPRLITVDRGMAVFPFSAKRQADFLEGNKTVLENVRQNLKQRGPTPVSLPTHGVVMEARLGSCSACEPFVEAHRELDLAMRSAEVDKAKAEAAKAEAEVERYQQRLSVSPPMLEDPSPAPTSFTIQIVGKSAPPDAAPSEP